MNMHRPTNGIVQQWLSLCVNVYACVFFTPLPLSHHPAVNATGGGLAAVKPPAVGVSAWVGRDVSLPLVFGSKTVVVCTETTIENTKNH